MNHKFETICLLGLSAYLVYFAYHNISPKQEIVSDSIQYKQVIEKKVEKLTAPEPVAPPIVDAPLARQDLPPKNLAPEGVFYLITAKSKEFESGIVSYRVGTPVTKIKPGKIRVPDGTVLDAKDEEISNDLDLVAFVSSIKNSVNTPPEIPKEEKIDVPPLVERKKTPEPVYNNPLNQGAKNKVDFGLKNLKGERRSFVK